MKTFEARPEMSWSDVYLASEYFAAHCGFRYPEVQSDSSSNSGTLLLRAPMKTQSDDETVQAGLMVWRNINYIPEIQLDKNEATLCASIANRRQLPYPVIKRTEAWIEALAYYLSIPTDDNKFANADTHAQRRFVERMLDM